MTRAYVHHPPVGAFDAIVIGSGVGGLVCATVLARYGRKRVLVLERHTTLGGFTHTFTRPGFEWDVGVHYVGQTHPGAPLRRIFDRLTDGRLGWNPLPDPYDRIELGVRSYPLYRGAEAFVEGLARDFPGSSDLLRRYLRLVDDVARGLTPYFVSRAFPSPLAALAVPASFRSAAARTTAAVLSELTSDPELTAVLTGQWLDHGLPPSRSSFAAHAAVVAFYLDGAGYPIGGASQIAECLGRVIEAEGGQIVTGAAVSSILVEDGRAVGVRVGEEPYRAPLVVSAIGARATFDRLLPDSARPVVWTRALEDVAPSMACFGLYLGMRTTDEELGLSGTNLWLCPDGNHDRNVERYASDPDAPFPVVYVSFPSAKDPTYGARFPGRSTIDVIAPAHIGHFDAWRGSRWMKRGADYEATKARVVERLLDVVLARLPQLRGRIAHAELSTPLSTAHFTGHAEGEVYGLEHSPARFASPLRAKTPVPGLYLAGTDVTMAGVGGASWGGIVGASAILGPKLVEDLTR